MRPRCHQLGHRVGQCRVRVHVEYRKCVTSIFHSSLVQDDRNKVHAGLSKQWCTRSIGEVPDVLCRDVAYNIVAIIHDGDASEPLIEHLAQGLG